MPLIKGRLPTPLMSGVTGSFQVSSAMSSFPRFNAPWTGLDNGYYMGLETLCMTIVSRHSSFANDCILFLIVFPSTNMAQIKEELKFHVIM